jgi:hypothetical protein
VRLPVLVGVIAAGLLLLGGGIALAVYCLSGDDESKPTRPSAAAEDDTDPDDSAPERGRPANTSLALDNADADGKKKPAKKQVRPGGSQPEIKPKGPALTAHARRVNAAIDQGVQFLRKALGNDARFKKVRRLGVRALAGLTLLSCGVPGNDPAVRRVAEAVRGQTGRLTLTYDLSVCVWFLDKLNDPADRPLLRTLALRLVAGQGFNGGWNYNCPVLKPADEEKLVALLKKHTLPSALESNSGSEEPTDPPKPRREVKREVFRRFTVDLDHLPALRFKPGEEFEYRQAGREDNSLTQFATLALWAALKHGVRAERALAFAEARFRAAQNPNGSWGYMWRMGRVSPGHNDSMACAGLLGIAVGRGVAPKGGKSGARPALTRDPVVARALAFLGKRVGDVPGRRPTRRGRGSLIGAAAGGDLYFLWSLERVGVVYDLKKVGEVNWYDWGSKILVDAQRPNGSWAEMRGPVVDTCFALLFLKRVNVVADLTTKLQKLEAN